MNPIQALAKKAMDDAGSDLVVAKRIAMSEASRDAELQRSLIAFAVETIIESEWRSGRSVRWNQARQDVDEQPHDVSEPRFGVGPTRPSEALTAGVRQAVEESKRRLMDWEMPGGKRLGDSTRGDLLQSASLLSKQADTMKLRSAWLNAVAGLLPNGEQPVKAVLREADLQRMFKRVNQEAA